MKYSLKTLLLGLAAFAVSSQALAAEPTSLNMDFPAIWNCKIVSGTWAEYAEPNVSIRVTSSTGTVACPVPVEGKLEKLTNAWVRVSTVGTGTHSCTLSLRNQSNGSLAGSKTLTAAHSLRKQSLKFNESDIPKSSSSEFGLYTLECTLSKDDVLHGYKVHIKF